MSSPSDPEQPDAPAGSRPPSTQEIPVVHPAGATAVSNHLPPHPDAARPAPVEAPQPTGPVDFVPGLPGLGAPPVPQHPERTAPPPPPVPPRPVPAAPDPAPSTAPATASGPIWPDSLDADEPERPPRTRRISAPRDLSALVRLGLVALSVALLELGLSLRFGEDSYWSTVPLWSAFATVCAVLGLAAFTDVLPVIGRLTAGRGWQVAAGGLVGLAVFWLLVVLPVVASDRGFVLTMALAALGAALWIGARTKA
ncbi:MAG: hypothetical protein JWR45_3112 [Blastococcus sp.]|nr:hypothetical protein [Blastococcus sp.]